MKKINILISGGPVHSYIDDVKVVSNRFKGGLIVQIIENLFDIVKGKGGIDLSVTYLCSKDSKNIGGEYLCYDSSIKVINHNGIDDYMEKVLDLAPEMDAVILGAAVVNLIPAKKIVGKFPSHNYKEGDIIPIDFTIAPRIIDRVKKVAPKTQLFGFKLLSDVSYNELIDSAYEVLLNSKATSIFANDTKNLNQKYIVCSDSSVHPCDNKNLAEWILERLEDEYYHTDFTFTEEYKKYEEEYKEHRYPTLGKIKELIDIYKPNFIYAHDFYYGAIAVRDVMGFLTTTRGKKDLKSICGIEKIDHYSKTIFASGKEKATLNAPLFDFIFENHKDVSYILHFHKEYDFLETQEWFPPGTVRDSQRKGISFNIKNHGCILSYDKNGLLLK